MEQSLGDRGDGEELVYIDAKVGGVHSTDKEPRPSQVCPRDMGLSLLIMR